MNDTFERKGGAHMVGEIEIQGPYRTHRYHFELN